MMQAYTSLTLLRLLMVLKSAFYAFDAREIVQMIRVPSYKNAEIVVGNLLFCEPWNWQRYRGNEHGVWQDRYITNAPRVPFWLQYRMTE
jgi:hypothetical protein